MKRLSVAIVTDASGNATVYSPSVYGRLLAITAVVGTLAVTTDITITEEDTALPLVTLTNIAASARYPVRIQAVDGTGTVISGAYDSPPVNGRIKAVVAQGGNVKSGSLLIDVDDLSDGSGASAFATRTFTPSVSPATYPAIIDSSDDPHLTHN